MWNPVSEKKILMEKYRITANLFRVQKLVIYIPVIRLKGLTFYFSTIVEYIPENNDPGCKE